MRYCKKCGTPNLYDALFCSFCGQAIPIDLASAERELKLLQTLEADTPAEALSAKPVDLIDSFLAEENHRRAKLVFSLSIVFLIIAVCAIANCAIMFVRHSNLWTGTGQAGIIIKDLWVYISYLLITMLSTSILILSIFLLLNARILKNNHNKPSETRMRQSKLLLKLLKYFIIVMSICVALEAFLFIYSAVNLSLVENAGGPAELAIVLLRFALDIIVCPMIIAAYRIMRRYRKMLEALPHLMKKAPI